MKLKHQNRATLSILVVFLRICAQINAFAIRDDACTSMAASSCNCFNGAEFEVECPKEDPNIVLRVELNRVEIECHTNSNRRIYTLLPDLNLSNMSRKAIDHVKFKYCPLPEGTTLKGIIVDKLGIDGVQTLTFSSRSDMQMRREQLGGLSFVRSLRFNGPISDLPEDTFYDLVNITALELRSNNVHLPINIFKNLRELEFLELGSNNLSNLAPGIFSNQHKLRRLNLWSNNLRNLTKDSFLGASSVTELDLSSNNIERLQSNVFDHFRDIENINLSHNRFVELPTELLSATKKLIKFRLMYNRVDLKTLPSAFLSNLPELDDVAIRCNIQFLPEDIFNGSTNIRNMSLQSNQLTTLPTKLFSSQRNLVNLDLSYNQLTDLPDNIFNSTKNLLLVRLSHNNLEGISPKIFFGLTQLTELYLDNNRLLTIHRDAFMHTNLQVLHLENNRLDFVKQISDPKDITMYSPFQHTGKLIRLNLRNNSIKHFLNEFNTFNPDLEVLDLSHNEISSLYLMQIAVTWQQPITVNLSNNQIKTIFSDKLTYAVALNDLVTLSQSIVDRQPNILWKWILNNNQIDCDCVILYFVKFLRDNPAVEKYLKVITDNLRCAAPANLHNQLIRNLKLDDLLCALDSPNTQNKYCPSKCRCWVRENDETAIFNCSNAGLTEVPPLPSLKSDIMKRLRKFELNIENNHISSLPNYYEPGYERVIKINARNNSIKQLSNENLPLNLTTLDISRNNLETLDGNLMMRLNYTGKLKSMVLAQNPWTCKCDSDFVKYIKLHPKKVDYENITCSDGKFIYTKSDVCPIETRLLILIGVLIALLGLFIGAVVALYYKYQQEVKVWLFAHNLCLWFVTEEELDKDKKYDAFISFSHKDEDFVTEQLVPELETGPHPFKICLHFRDWVVGEFIPNQISKSVEDSRRTIVVLTPNFIDSIWGRMEFRAAHKNALDEGRTRLIVIIYGDIGDIEKLDPELKVYLKTNTYVKWGDPWFFDKLRYALPHPTNYKSKGLIKSTMKSSIDDKLELIKPQAVTPPLTTPPAEQAGQNPLIGKLNGENAKYHSGLNGLNGHVNGAFIINTNAKQSDV